MILDGLSLPPEAPRDMTVLPQMLADLSGPAGPDELTGEAAALSRFKVCFPPVSVSSPAAAPATRRRSWLASHRARLAAALAAAAVALSAAAAYAGVLPAPVQTLAHQMIGAPMPHHTSGHPSKAKPGGPRPAVHGAAKRHGKAAHPLHPGNSGHRGHSGLKGHPSHPVKPPHPHNPGNSAHQGGQGNQNGQGNQGHRPHPGHPAHPGHPGHPGHLVYPVRHRPLVETVPM
jgi:hypothetical protein